jgi:hypothetical protein
MLLRLLVQAAIDGVWSSRKIDRLAHENVGTLPEGTKASLDNGYFSGANCGECPFLAECAAGKGKIRVITSDGYEAERRRMAAKMRLEAGKEEYKKRKEA